MTGDHFRELRLATSLKSKQCAEFMGVTTECVSRWENGHQTVPVYAQRLISYAVRYGVEPAPSWQTMKNFPTQGDNHD